MSFITTVDHATDYAMINDIINSDDRSSSESINDSPKYSTPPSDHSMDQSQHCSEEDQNSKQNHHLSLGNGLEFGSSTGTDINAGVGSSPPAMSIIVQRLEQLEKMNFAMFEAIRQVSQQIYSCDTKLSEILTNRTVPINARVNVADIGAFHSSRKSEPNAQDAHQRRKLSWNERLEELKVYKGSHGHCDVPQVHDSGLGTWVSSQRSQHKRFKAGKTSSMTKSRKEILEKLGFSWSLRKRFSWDERFKELKDYYEAKGTTEVPNDPNHKSLWAWCQSQRRSYRNAVEGKGPVFPAERIEILNEIGFNWTSIAADYSSLSTTTPSSGSTGSSNSVFDPDDIPAELENHEEIELHL